MLIWENEFGTQISRKMKYNFHLFTLPHTYTVRFSEKGKNRSHPACPRNEYEIKPTTKYTNICIYSIRRFIIATSPAEI